MRRVFRFPWRTARQIGHDVDEELRFHLETRAEELRRAGLTDEDARREALREFGDVEDARTYCVTVDRHTEAAARRGDIMSDFATDLGYAFRKLRKSPAFTITAIITLALGIGANTAIFSVVNGVILKPLDFPDPDRVVRLQYMSAGEGDAGTPMDLIDYRARAKAFEGFALMEGAAINLVTPDADAERLGAVRVSANWFSLLGARPLLGRTFVEGEDTREAPRTVVLSEALWRRRFNADPKILGRSLSLNGDPYIVVGVMSAAQQYPITAELWTPLVFGPQQQTDGSRGARWLGMLARVRSDATLETATADMARVTAELNREYPDDYNNRTATPVPLQEWLTGEIRTPLLVIMGAVAFVLLIACANVANLLLVRATGRESELAVRTALGAGEGRLVRQLVTESLVLTMLGAIAGVALAHLVMGALIGAGSATLPQLRFATIDLTTLALTAGIAIATGVLFGVLPARQLTRGSLAVALRAGSRGTRTRPGTLRLRRTIVIAEVAMAVTLLTGAGLLLRSFDSLLRVDSGFDPEHVMTYNANLPSRVYDGAAPMATFVSRLEESLATLPGVSSAAVATELPLAGQNFVISFNVRGRPEPPANDPPASRIISITPDFFKVTGIALLRGRSFARDDRAGAPQVAIVNRAFVQKFFPGEDPIGKYVELGWTVDSVRRGGQIVGVSGDVRQSSLDGDLEPIIYLPYAQAPRASLAVAARTAGPVGGVAPAMRAQLRELDPQLAMYNLRPMEELVSSSVATQRFYATLLALFAAVALVLAAVGLYGVIAYAVGQRTHELGVRVALGASRERITRMVVGEGLTMTVIGVAVGVAGALVVTRVIASLLFGIGARDPLTFIGVAAVLIVVAVLASYLPARRAAAVDPLVAMRGD